LETMLAGKAGAAPQSLHITLSATAGKAVEITAAVPGGRPSHATVKTADGKPITLVLPRYACRVPPMPTICPAQSALSNGHLYSFSFAASPSRPILLSATVGPVI